jgi:hypothetical protein
VTIVVIGLIVLGWRLEANADNLSNKVDSIAASMSPAPSVYNAKLTVAVDADTGALAAANRTLTAAGYLSGTPDYVNLQSAVADSRSTLDLSAIFQNSTLSKEDYVTEMASLDGTFDVLRTAQAAVESDVAATPGP